MMNRLRYTGSVNYHLEKNGKCPDISEAYAVVIALGIFLIGAIGAFMVPKYDWDMVAYVGLIKEQTYIAPDEIQSATYDAVRALVPEKTFEELKYKNQRRRIAYENPISFAETLSFYRVRVGYWGLGYLLTSFGFDEIMAYRIVNSFFYFAVCAVVFFHLSYAIPDNLIVIILSGIMALYPPLLNYARVIVPDMMGLFAVVLGFSFLLRQYLVIGALVMVLAVFIRTDLGILCFFLAIPTLFTGTNTLTRRVASAMILLLAIPLVLWLNFFFGHPGWAKLITTWFIQTLYFPETAAEVSVSISDYLKILARQSTMLFQVNSLWVSFLLGVAMLYELCKRGSFREPLLLWYGAIVAYLVARFMLWPVLVERYVLFCPIVFLLLFAHLRNDMQRET